MKVGDLVQYRGSVPSSPSWVPLLMGTIIEFPPAKHAKEVQKVTVLTENGIEKWTMQFCELIGD